MNLTILVCIIVTVGAASAVMLLLNRFSDWGMNRIQGQAKLGRNVQFLLLGVLALVAVAMIFAAKRSFPPDTSSPAATENILSHEEILGGTPRPLATPEQRMIKVEPKRELH